MNSSHTKKKYDGYINAKTCQIETVYKSVTNSSDFFFVVIVVDNAFDEKSKR